MVFIDVTREEIREMVEKYFRDETGKTKIYTNGAVDEIVDIVFSYEKDDKIDLNLTDWLHYNITFWDSVGEAVENGINVGDHRIVEDNNEMVGKSQIILVEY